MERINDIIIVGGGPAGLTAGLYAARARLKTLLLEGEVLGGQAATTELVENYPGFPDGISGPELMERIERQARFFGLEISAPSMATSIKIKGEAKEIAVEGTKYPAKAVIIATGARPKKLNVPGERELQGRGVSYCATCDGALFKGKKLLVIGGGDAAMEEVLFLTKFARSILVVHRRDELRAAKILQERVFDNKKVGFVWDSQILRILGESRVEGAIVRNKKSGEEREIKTDGIFVYIGTEPNTTFLGNLLKLDREGYIVTDENMMTSIPGIFAAGDVRCNPLKQISVAVGEGATAAISAQKYIEGHLK
ncbi:MAG: thioredoxin-disulfide reductase [Actinomycetota bacterium]|nr:thioredoxin-disulfide reductase [Actinomycetota bacterium]